VKEALYFSCLRF